MQFDKSPKFFVTVIAVSAAIIIAAVCYNIWAHARPDKGVPASADLSMPDANASSEASMSEDKWEERYAAELAAAQKAFEEAYETEKSALADELAVTKNQLDETRAELLSKALPELDIHAVREKYEEVGELVTINYEYEYTSKATDNGKALSIFGSGDLIFWDTKEFLYKIPGTMKLGVDVSAINDGLSIDDNAKTITVTIPPAYVIANDPNESDVERYDIQKGWLNSNPVTDQDLLIAFSTLEADTRQKVQNNGMLKYAQQLAGHQIQELLQPIATISGYSIALDYIAHTKLQSM